jgi:hypothetical protein
MLTAFLISTTESKSPLPLSSSFETLSLYSCDHISTTTSVNLCSITIRIMPSPPLHPPRHGTPSFIPSPCHSLYFPVFPSLNTLSPCRTQTSSSSQISAQSSRSSPSPGPECMCIPHHVPQTRSFVLYSVTCTTQKPYSSELDALFGRRKDCNA